MGGLDFTTADSEASLYYIWDWVGERYERRISPPFGKCQAMIFSAEKKLVGNSPLIPSVTSAAASFVLGARL